ncbi:hypothetical protein [Oceanicola sp. 502str15]|uniref:hypothetical protein n=1 Tax=Oceanicola sp. 502str15 TaxID=2696061 RepID=UPI0020943541|nr:hypothetical protein [Oceanicola sp. 502str15]MCO6384518.1 hypothetical protein [Oceanicola sp. 502str15]
MKVANYLTAAAGLEDFSQAEVEAMLGQRLTRTRDAGAWIGFSAPGAGDFAGFELRSPGPTARFGGLLIGAFPAPLPLDALAPALAARPFLRQEMNPPPMGAAVQAPTGGRWYRLGAHELAVSFRLTEPVTATALAVHGAYP